jgi:hypothetical protein
MANGSGTWLALAAAAVGLWVNQPPPAAAENEKPAAERPAEPAGASQRSSAGVQLVGDLPAEIVAPGPIFKFVAYVSNAAGPEAQSTKVTAHWSSPDGKTEAKVVWEESGDAPLKVGTLRAMRGSLTIGPESAGEGVLRILFCPEVTPGSCKTIDKKLVLRRSVVARNEQVVWAPVAGAFVMIALGLGLSRLWKGTGLSVGTRSSRFDLTESTVATLTIGASLLGSAVSLGVDAKHLEPFLTKAELAAWTILYALATTLAPLIFEMFKGTHTGLGTIVGFVLGNFFNIAGALGQLLLGWYLLQALPKAGIVSLAAGEYLRWIPVIAGAAVCFYVVSQFAAARSGGVGTSGSERSFLF